MKKDERQKREFIQWFLHEKVSRLIDCKPIYTDIALAMNYVDFTMQDDANEWALYEIIDDLVKQARQALQKGSKKGAKALLRTKRAILEAMQFGGDLPKSINGMFADYSLRAIVILSKPLNTIYCPSDELDGWNGLIVDK
jgi:hypothetical protein